MPRAKKPRRNPLGSITVVEVVIAGRTVKRFDASKRYTKPDGTRGKKFKRCRSQAEAQTALVNFQTEIEREIAGEVKPKVIILQQLFDHFDRQHIRPPVIMGTRQKGGYRQDHKTLRAYITRYLDFFDPGKDIRQVTFADLERFRDHLLTIWTKAGTVPKPATVNRQLALLRRIFNVAIEEDWLERNPFNRGKGRSLIDAGTEEGRERVLSLDEEARLLAACDKPDIYTYNRSGSEMTVNYPGRRAHLKAALIMAVETGLRKTEQFTTKVRQVDFDRQIIELNFKQTKALKARTVPISERLEPVLRELIESKNLKPGDLIFEGSKDFDRAFRTACRIADISNLRWHDLRHTAATRMEERGIPDALRREILGHSSVEIGDRYVNATTPEMINSYRERMKGQVIPFKKEAA